MKSVESNTNDPRNYVDLGGPHRSSEIEEDTKQSLKIKVLNMRFSLLVIHPAPDPKSISLRRSDLCTDGIGAQVLKFGCDDIYQVVGVSRLQFEG